MCLQAVTAPIRSCATFLDQTSEDSRLFTLCGWMPVVGNIASLWKTSLILKQAAASDEPKELTSARCKKLTNPQRAIQRAAVIIGAAAILSSPAAAISLIAFELICDVYSAYRVVKQLHHRR